ncbi:MAG: hypothetical protein U0794_16245, partial [Isosphaeraceae bacterium]
MRSNQTRKIIYGLIIVGLFGAMFPYSNWLNQEKQRHDLGEAAIGQIDTGSFMLKLALLGGARGMAANVLWNRAEELKREQDWDRMAATVDMITKLQPHFLSVWTFQGWNLAYNVSVEWDAPEDKYEWIKKGIKFLQDGVRKNRRSPDLVWDTAWTYYHKLGFSDESIILRKLFRDDEDEDFKTYVDPETGNRVVSDDNFMLGYGWFSRAVALVDEGNQRLTAGTKADIEYVDPAQQRKGRPGDLAFRSMPAHARTRYAQGLEKASMVGVPATFGEVARNAWSRSLDEWQKFGEFEFPAYNNPSEMIRLDDSTNPERYAKLSENQKYWTSRWADQMNYRYWKDRCAAEMTVEGAEARRLFYEGTLAYKSASFDRAVQRYKEGLDIWKKLLEKHTDYRSDDFNKKDTGLIVKRYVRALRQLGEEQPKDLPFKDLLAAAEQDNTVDPFDATEMIGPSRPGTPTAPSGGRTSPGTVTPPAPTGNAAPPPAPA